MAEMVRPQPGKTELKVIALDQATDVAKSKSNSFINGDDIVADAEKFYKFLSQENFNG